MERVFFTFFLLFPVFSWAVPIPQGYPNKGVLDSGESIFKVITEHSDILISVSPAEYQFGATQMDEAILAIGSWSKELKRQPVWIGDVSKRGGGKLAHHLTHQRGLDADIAYLVFEHKRKGHRSSKFHNRFTEQFGVKSKIERNFDLESNYRLLDRAVREPNVSSIYVGCTIYDALEAYDKKNGGSIMGHIFAQKGHEDHFHIRLKCPENVIGCSNEWWKDPSNPQKASTQKESVHKKYRDC